MEITPQCLLQFHYNMISPRVVWINQTCLLWTCCTAAPPPSCKMASCSGEAAVLFLFIALEGLWRSWLFTPLESGQLFSPIQNSCEIFSLIQKEKSNLIASCGCVWLPSIRGIGKCRCKVSLLPDTLIPVSRSHRVICCEVHTVFLFNALGN